MSKNWYSGPPSATNERQIRERDNQARLDREIDREVINALMCHKNGRRWVWRQLERGQLFHDNGVIDHAAMAFEKGRRSIILALFNDVTAFTPDEYIIMTRENANNPLLSPPQTDEIDNG